MFVSISSVFPRIRYRIVFGILLSKLNSLYKLSFVFQNAPEVSMDLIVPIFVIHAIGKTNDQMPNHFNTNNLSVIGLENIYQNEFYR
jgi:hypothetical protein